jgi:quinoprotein glucose dehydrogenase
MRLAIFLFCCAAPPLLLAGAKNSSRTWSTYGGSPANIHYSSLNQVNRKNVSKLQIAWTFDTGDAFPGSEMECNPIIVNGTLFATSPKLRLFAVDAATGRSKWIFDPNQGHPVRVKMRNRGVAYWRDPSGASDRIFYVVRQYLYALNAASGQLIPGFAAEGRLDLRRDLGRDPAQMFVSDTSPPLIYKDLIIVGSIVSESLPASPGDIRAYDVRTGKLRWSFHTIPHPGEFGYDSWPSTAWQYIGGVNNWSGMSLDVARGIVFAPLGSASFDFYGANRLGDNLFANSLLALNAATGERIWHYQTVHHDLWDRDLPTPPALVTVQHDGRSIDAAAQITKSGFVYLFERATGKPLFPIESRSYPSSEAPGEVTAPRQPLPAKPAPFARQILTEDLLTTRTPAAHQAVLEHFRKLQSAGQFTPPSIAGTVVFPGFDGGGEWGGAAFDPETGLLYVNSNEIVQELRLVPREPASQSKSGKEIYLSECAGCHRQDLAGSPPEFPSLQHVADRLDQNEVMDVLRQGSGRMPSFARLSGAELGAVMRYIVYGEDVAVKPSEKAASPDAAFPIDQRFRIDGYNKFLDPDGYPAVKPPWGTLNAINLNTGEYAWKIPLGEYPELAAQGLRNTGTDNYGGGVVTAGGLFFIAATNYDNKLHAFDKATGELLWETTLPAAGNATPAVYEVSGRQYLVIACGGGKTKSGSGSSYLAFALPDK